MRLVSLHEGFLFPLLPVSLFISSFLCSRRSFPGSAAALAFDRSPRSLMFTCHARIPPQKYRQSVTRLTEAVTHWAAASGWICLATSLAIYLVRFTIRWQPNRGLWVSLSRCVVFFNKRMRVLRPSLVILQKRSALQEIFMECQWKCRFTVFCFSSMLTF